MAFPIGSNPPPEGPKTDWREKYREVFNENKRLRAALEKEHPMVDQTPPPEPTPPKHKGHPSQEWGNYPKNKIPEPTIGRMVYYYHPAALKPCAAIVADCDGLMVNLGVLNHDGTGGPAMAVQHVSQAASGQVSWDWMPFQKGQAAKTEQLQAELDAKSSLPYAGGQGAAGAMPGSK